MIVIEKKEQARAQVAQWRREGKTIGLVPTMGYLHAGHRSLIERARKECDCVVVSIFVNPTQFGENEDFDKYPQDIIADSTLCKAAGVDVIFHPSANEMYPKNYSTYVTVEGLTEGLCGRSRPTHFRGVCSVVMKLMHIITPDFAYFGQKDAQQLLVIQRMVRDMDMPVTVVGCPIVRDGEVAPLCGEVASVSEAEGELVSPLEGNCSGGDKPLPSSSCTDDNGMDGEPAELSPHGEPPLVSPLEGIRAKSDKPLPTSGYTDGKETMRELREDYAENDTDAELNGLALSSRNSYLNAEERCAALVLSRALRRAKALINDGEQDTATIKAAMTATIEAEPLARIDYIEIVDLEELKPIEKLDCPYLVALAVYIGKTRLIDNFSAEPARVSPLEGT